MTHPKKLLIMAGGSGGHIFPALAVAEALKAQNVQVEWLGTAARMEADIIPKTDIPFHTISVRAVRGQGLLRKLLSPLNIGLAVFQAMQILIRIKPDAVLGMGGFASGPGGLAAKLLRIPLIIHEQNAVPSKTNQILARVANRVLESFPGSFGNKHQAVVTGNPVRADLLSVAEPEVRMPARQPVRLLVLGGSQGAKKLNDTVPAALALLPEAERPEVWHQCGAKKADSTRSQYEQINLNARVQAFVENMRDAYTWADLAICRAGALTIAELAAVGLGSVLVPYPHAVDDHQTHNSQYLVNAEAAICVPEAELSASALADLFKELFRSHTKLIAMARAARCQAQADATQIVARHCMELCDVEAEQAGS